MATPVKEDIRIVRPPLNVLRVVLALSLAAGLLLVSASPVFGAPPADDAETGSFVAGVRDLSHHREQLHVPLNHSVLVRTTVEFGQVNVVAAHIADASPVSATELLVTGRSYGTTTIALWGPDNQQYMLEVSVEPDLATLNQALQTIDPLSDAEAQTILGNIVLTGTVSGAEQAQRMIEIAELFNPPSSTGAKFTVKNHLNVSGEQQVLLRCIVAEVNRTASRQLGINGFLAGDNFSEGFLINQVGGVNPINIGAGADALVTQNIPFLTGEDGIPNGTAPTLTLGFPRVQMEVFIKALRNNGLLRVLAEPNLVATSGETATFLAGGEFPYPVPQGLGSVGVEFKEYGVQLNFTPVVRVGETILLRVQPRVSELDFSAGVILEGYSVPGVTARTAQTTVEIGSGQTIAIAGLLSERTRGVSNSVPGLGDLPVLGALFSSVEYTRSMTELVIFVTPQIVSPLEPHQVAPPPGFKTNDPSDWELFALGRLESQGRAHEAAPAGPSQDLVPRTDPPTTSTGLTMQGPWGYATAQDR